MGGANSSAKCRFRLLIVGAAGARLRAAAEHAGRSAAGGAGGDKTNHCRRAQAVDETTTEAWQRIRAGVTRPMGATKPGRARTANAERQALAAAARTKARECGRTLEFRPGRDGNTRSGAVLELARADAPLDGFATFHSGLAIPEGENYSRVQAPLPILHGWADTFVPMSVWLSWRLRWMRPVWTTAGRPTARPPHASCGVAARYRPQADSAS